MKVYDMPHPLTTPRILVYSTKQQDRIGQVLANAISEGRAFEVTQHNSQVIHIKVSPADDLGHVYEINAAGHIRDIGATE